MDKEIQQFCENYEVQVLNDQKRRARRPYPTFFSDPLRADVIQNTYTTVETEKVFTVDIPESRLRTLVELEKRFFNMHKHTRHEVDMFDLLLEKEREESFYRHSNAAVQKAYEQYSIMLNLAGYQRKI